MSTEQKQRASVSQWQAINRLLEFIIVSSYDGEEPGGLRRREKGTASLSAGFYFSPCIGCNLHIGSHLNKHKWLSPWRIIVMLSSKVRTKTIKAALSYNMADKWISFFLFFFLKKRFINISNGFLYSCQITQLNEKFCCSFVPFNCWFL